ncbi:hypothetical protein AAFF_G00384000 [Aldrovandia affinis]|uniref:Uncharacterized protein n=1 Tax=Aldrovandia affinis TaxID=143900 RepID=A0AAD7SHD8_9TELE|nr:hypothetical protein AAFF_G00384000 [Aldrovandia affinis]
MELYWYIVVILFIIIKIFFYICWYRSRQRQLAAYISNPRNAQIVIVGGRAYLHQASERQNTSTRPSWRSAPDDRSLGETPGPHQPTASYSPLDSPPPYDAISRTDELKPPPYSECAQGGATGGPWDSPPNEIPDPLRVSGAPPPYKPHPHTAAGHPREGEGPPSTGP